MTSRDLRMSPHLPWDIMPDRSFTGELARNHSRQRLGFTSAYEKARM